VKGFIGFRKGSFCNPGIQSYSLGGWQWGRTARREKVCLSFL